MITLNTIIYEGNYESLLSPDNWFFKFKSKFITNKLITINNIISMSSLLEKIDILKKEFNFDVVFVDKELAEAKELFNLNIDNTTLGYNYTIPYFVSLNNVKTEFILNIATDCMADIQINDEYLELSINELKSNPICLTTMVSWTKDNYIMDNGKKIGEYEETETFRILGIEPKINDKFNYRANFTDQFFMGSIDKLKRINYNMNEMVSKQIYNGPAYGGNSFEKRMATYQIGSGTFNCVFKGNQYYIHDKNYY